MHEGSSSFTELRACVPCVRSHACAGLRSLRINTTARKQAVMAAQAAAPLFFRVLSIPPIIKEYHLINYFSRYGQVLNVYLVCLYSSSVPSYHCSSSSLISFIINIHHMLSLSSLFIYHRIPSACAHCIHSSPAVLFFLVSSCHYCIPSLDLPKPSCCLLMILYFFSLSFLPYSLEKLSPLKTKVLDLFKFWKNLHILNITSIIIYHISSLFLIHIYNY